MINRHKKKLQWALLLCVVLALVAYAVYSQFLVVTPFYNKFDPEIPYLLNALGIFEGHAYHYADHPGTPINLAGTLLFLLLNPLALFSQADFSYDVLLHPERFLLVARLLVSALNILAVIFLWRFSRDKVSLPGLTFILTSYFIGFGPGSWTATVYWSHNAFCFALGTAFLFLTYRTLSSDSPRTGQRLAWLGAGAGFLLSIQLYFVAWVVGLLAVVFFLLLLERQSWWAYITAGGAVVGGTLASYLVVNLPVLHRFPYMFAWFGRLITTLGKYDEGEAGVLSLSVLWKSFLDYQGNGFSLLFIMVGLLLLGFAVLALRRGTLLRIKCCGL